MAHNLPTYEEATSRDHWRLVGPYIHPQDLFAACLVSRQWSELFTPLLWGTPSSQFAGREGMSYVRKLIMMSLGVNIVADAVDFRQLC
jgi:F-box-like